MTAQIALITLLTDRVPELAAFYRDVFGFKVKSDLGPYVELENEGVRFAICTREIMFNATGSETYRQPFNGQAFELAFPVDSPTEVDRTYTRLIAQGAQPVTPPADLPWGQRAAFFADPEGYIHEIFADLPK